VCNDNNTGEEDPPQSVEAMTSKQRRDLVKFAKQLTKEGKHQAAMSVWELLQTR